MTPKEKAEELVNKYEKFVPSKISYLEFGGDLDDERQIIIESKQCALIAVDEILQVIEDNSLEYDDNFWDKVKTEIEKL